MSDFKDNIALAYWIDATYVDLGEIYNAVHTILEKSISCNHPECTKERIGFLLRLKKRLENRLKKFKCFIVIEADSNTFIDSYCFGTNSTSAHENIVKFLQLKRGPNLLRVLTYEI